MSVASSVIPSSTISMTTSDANSHGGSFHSGVDPLQPTNKIGMINIENIFLNSLVMAFSELSAT